MARLSASTGGRLPVWGWCGLVLVAIFWIFNWTADGLRTHVGFFPLWLGFVFFVDGVVYRRKGHSLLTRNWRRFVELFALSIPVWWLFELFNARLQNWIYLGREHFSHLEFALLASLSFSTVIPAVFEAAELMSTFPWSRRCVGRKALPASTGLGIGCILLGFAQLTAMLIWPEYCFVFAWMNVFFVVEGLNILLGFRGLVFHLQRGDWRPIVNLWTGVLLCGFFWELWNVYSYPKWIYRVPFVDFFHIFEMPIIGYLGYLPFSLELFSLYHFYDGILKRKDSYLKISDE